MKQKQVSASRNQNKNRTLTKKDIVEPKNCNCRVCRRCKEEGVAQYFGTGNA